jgi:hypothetical protein
MLALRCILLRRDTNMLKRVCIALGLNVCLLHSAIACADGDVLACKMYNGKELESLCERKMVGMPSRTRNGQHWWHWRYEPAAGRLSE